MIRRGLTRLVVLVGAVAVAVGLLSTLAGVIGGASTQRSVSLGYMLSGAVIALLGAGAGLRVPSRHARRPDQSYTEQRLQAVGGAAVVLTLGMALLLLGLALDPNSSLV